MFINLTGKKNQHMQKDLKDRSQRSETFDSNMAAVSAAVGRDDERLDPSTPVLTVLARISERGCQNSLIRSIATKIEMTYIS